MTGQPEPDSGPDRFPPQVLRDYALLADGERGALLGPRGDIVWMCAPRWDSDAVFAALLGGPGGYSDHPGGPVRLGRLLRRGQHDLAQPLGHQPRHHRMPGSPRVPR